MAVWCRHDEMEVHNYPMGLPPESFLHMSSDDDLIFSPFSGSARRGVQTQVLCRSGAMWSIRISELKKGTILCELGYPLYSHEGEMEWFDDLKARVQLEVSRMLNKMAAEQDRACRQVLRQCTGEELCVAEALVLSFVRPVHVEKVKGARKRARRAEE